MNVCLRKMFLIWKLFSVKLYRDKNMQNAKRQFPRSTKTPENGLVTLADLLVLLHTKESPSDPVHTAK